MKKPVAKTHYQTLGMSEKASAAELHTMFKALAVRWHPDKVSVAERKKHEQHSYTRPRDNCSVCARTAQFTEITVAYSVLKDSKRRAAYDATLLVQRQCSSSLDRVCSKCNGVGFRVVGFKGTRQRCTQCAGEGVLRDC